MNTRLTVVVWIALVAALALSLGCHHKDSKVKDHRDRQEIVVERTEHGPPPGTVVITEPPPTREVVIVREAPPPLIVETRPPPPPGPEMIWVNGYWVHDHGHYVWCKGRYVRPMPGQRHEPARWEHTRRGWEFHGERWDHH